VGRLPLRIPKVSVSCAWIVDEEEVSLTRFPSSKLVNLRKLLLQLIEGGIDKPIAKTEWLKYGCTLGPICTTSR
jgi:hypothetical protein